MTSAYTTALTAGGGLAAAITVPIADWLDDWRFGLGVWAVIAALGLPPWLLLAWREHGQAERTAHSPAIGLRGMAHTRLGWAMLLAFGLQGAQAFAVFGWLAQRFRDAGTDPATAGVLVAITAAIGIPVSLLIPVLCQWRRDQRWLVTLSAIFGVAGYLGTWQWPLAAPYLWASMLGISFGMFPLLLTLFGLRSRDPEITGRLSAFGQSGGYLLSAIGPLGVGWLYGRTHGWDGPMGLLLGLLVPMTFAAWFAAGNRFVDDELAGLSGSGGAGRAGGGDATETTPYRQD